MEGRGWGTTLFASHSISCEQMFPLTIVIPSNLINFLFPEPNQTLLLYMFLNLGNTFTSSLKKKTGSKARKLWDSTLNELPRTVYVLGDVLAGWSGTFRLLLRQNQGSCIQTKMWFPIRFMSRPARRESSWGLNLSPELGSYLSHNHLLDTLIVFQKSLSRNVCR